ncbi:DUF4225 domain-containing protein [Morganella morganii]|uniref:DUF4225 domain-containing protein n=1 Tax=Morganella morganii TaxID=582 RepID=UPI0023685D4A|nr:DUF4225 domain-containing protein [Morganella morganii]
MSQYELDYSFSDAYQSTLNNISNELRKEAETIAFMHIHNSEVRMKFLRDISQFISRNEWEVRNACLSLSAGLDNIEDMRELLEEQRRAIQLQEVRQYAYVEAVKNEKNGVTTLFLKQVGFVGGGMQIIAGYGACAASVGLLCSSLSVGLIAQGTNNMYENGYYLLFRENTSGYLRDGYRYVSKELGYGNDEADMIYNFVDLTLSAGGMVNPALKPGAFKLYNYIDTDFIATWRLMSPAALYSEGFLDAVTIYSTYDLYNNKSKK